jgi:hypothetical protein
MAEAKINYGSDVALAVTAWSTGLTTQQFATSAIFDNTTSLFEDVILGGIIELDATTPVAGDTLDIYIVVQYSETTLDMSGGIDALLSAAAEQIDSTDFVKANLKLLDSVAVESDTPATAQGYHWDGSVVNTVGYMPKRFMLLLHNNTAGTLATGSDVNTVGITHTVI